MEQETSNFDHVDQLSDQVVMVCDLDGTLIKTDSLHEMLLALAVRRPAALINLPRWLSQGRAAFKAQVADYGVRPTSLLPLNEGVMAVISAAREAGQPTVLVSAADHRQVTDVATDTGLFDAAYGSAEGRNLKGAEKAEFLVERFGAGNFDYIGDSKADIPVWAVARQAITVGASASLRKAAEAANANTVHIDPPSNKLAPMLRAMRPHQWSKNALLFVPMLASHDFTSFLWVLLAFVAFSLTASAVYLINDLLDLPSDREHPRKCKRPFAAGELKASAGIIMAGLLFLIALTLGALVGMNFLIVLCLYLVVTFLYSLWLKRKVLVDVLTLAGLYTVRIIAGAAAASVPMTPWLLAFSMFLFLCLAAVKRQAELIDQLQSGRASAGRGYETDDLPVLRGIALSAAHAAVMVLALYINSPDVTTLYSQPIILWVICPLVLYWTLRMVMKAHRGQMTDDPIVFAATDPISIGLVAASSAVVLTASIS